jgi:recombinational DNA repair protein (RecF pathway)
VQGYRDDGVVLRTHKLGEADRIITLLTRHHGRVRAVAKGVRRTKSRWGARLEPFTHVDVMVHAGRTLDTITQAEVIRAYGTRLVTNYPKYTAGSAMLETAERFTPVEKEPAIRQFLLLVGGLRALGDAVEPDLAQSAPRDLTESAPGDLADSGIGDQAESDAPSAPADPDDLAGPGNLTGPGKPADSADPADPSGPGTVTGPEEPRDPRMVLDAYFLRSLTFAGYTPALEACARCGVPSKPLVGFAVAAGGMVCADCRPPGAASPAALTVALMVALLQGDWDKAMRSDRRHRVECSGLVAAYLQWHLEHSIRSLRHVERA